MVERDLYKDILDKGLTLDHYFVLCNIRDGTKMVESSRVQGFINLLVKKEYIKDDVLTQKAVDLISGCVKVVNGKEIPLVKQTMLEWIAGIHKRLEDKLVTETGNTQIRDKVRGVGRSFAFLPNEVDLKKKLLVAIKEYKIKDWDKLERTLMRHIENCKIAKSWFPIMYYYIYKDGRSQMVSDMEDIDTSKVNKSDDNEQFQTIDTGGLF